MVVAQLFTSTALASQNSISVMRAANPVALKYRLVSEIDESPTAVLHAILPAALIARVAVHLLDAEAMPLAVLPLTAVGSGGNTGLPQLAFPMLPSCSPLPLVDRAVRHFADAMPIKVAAKEAALVSLSALCIEQQDAVTLALAEAKAACVHAAIRHLLAPLTELWPARYSGGWSLCLLHDGTNAGPSGATSK
eukprot:CAMPEP_0181452968 /NCGR_PEP_ID=MMETSP1110-20121109/29482_1 /TAXON_ID=174948 /ORGANISM="Symbiodinium sp., Strain CCMP421" /LENGTH=192 /DNA_ID=CAMNT_0023577271 /DNA_START=159 /DNA_END=734 /DNA_ORIENTATION=-